MQIRSHPWYYQRHHTENGFQNIWDNPRETPFLKAAGWLLGHTFQQKENERTPVREVDAEALATTPQRLRITWLGHATTLIQAPGLTLLTDPHFSGRASPFSFMGPVREVPLPLPPDALPPVDAVLLSHDHYDHLDKASIRTLVQEHAPLFLAPLGVGDLLRSWGARRVVEMDWWQYVDLDGWRFHATPAKHFSGRGLTNRNSTLWTGWYLESLGDDLTIYFAGDSAYADLFTTIRDRLGPPDVALMPIGAYLPRWFMAGVHVDPQEAIQALIDVGARHAVPIHWGTFDLADEPIHEPPALARRAAAEAGLADRFHVLDIGGTFALDDCICEREKV